MIFAVVHAILFSILLLNDGVTQEAKVQLFYMPFLIGDFPIILFYSIPVEIIGDYLRFADNPILANIFHSPSIIDCMLGTIWWYFVPKFFLPKRLGGIWGSKAAK
ncbi:MULTISPECIES: hypothetical protein [unclassified Novosphingobium]|uniref:hypothetical protein n=1 Tax=unclassified Novosphingobium TaxID=2644732 RepID=UPI00146EC9CF|nr:MULTISPECIES: hypothetical protein [unclassified Novosphingobium]NMN04116.1 hypothetical protein [Novosphingobium sp. SG919]NMN85894.1 hypothetical protein [Novosphingobium sp. SG916]